MNAKEKLIKGGFITDTPEFKKYEPYLDNIFKAVTDYGYVSKIVASQQNDSNIGRKDTEEHCVFKVADKDKKSFKEMMEDLNIFLKEETLTKDGKAQEFYSFKSRNLPELKSIVRGVVKVKENEQAQINMAKLQARGFSR